MALPILFGIQRISVPLDLVFRNLLPAIMLLTARTSVFFLTGGFAGGGNHSSLCSGLWTVAQISALSVEVAVEGMAIPSALLDLATVHIYINKPSHEPEY